MLPCPWLDWREPGKESPASATGVPTPLRRWENMTAMAEDQFTVQDPQTQPEQSPVRVNGLPTRG